MAAITYTPCRLEHIKLIEPLDDTHRMEQAVFMLPNFRHLVEQSFCLSAWHENRCVGAAGIFPIYPHKGMAWAFLSKHSCKHMREFTRMVKKVLDETPTKRVEMLVVSDYEQGHKWAKMLGFEVEAERMVASGFYGQDETLYARVKP